MTQPSNALYLACGTLKVSSKGYWFTAGGEKGAQGYYPHLKDANGNPIYPDTQIHGDLAFGARWLEKLEAGYESDLIGAVFGRKGGRGPSLLKTGDLQYIHGDWPPDFQVKAKTSIDDEVRTVENHMLVDREYAYYGPKQNSTCRLSTRLYLGYTTDPKTLKEAKDLVKEAAEFLSGFGNARSRGSGRGVIEVEWHDDEVIQPPENLPDPGKNRQQLYHLEALVNMRNRPIAPGTSQVISTLYHLTQDQLRSWFAKTYFQLFGQWPTPDQMGSIRFSGMYPAERETATLGYRAPMTTIVWPDHVVEDMWGRTDRDDDAAQETLMHAKSKPLPPEYCVSQDGNRILQPVPVSRRIRNCLDDAFVTQENSLFVQELVLAGACFGGEIEMENVEKDFAANAQFILESTKPILNGTIFEPTLAERPAEKAMASAARAHLVTQPISLTGQWMDRIGVDPQESFCIETLRRYDTAHKRPRRNRIVIGPGSVLGGAVAHHTVAWPGFGEQLDHPQPTEPDSSPQPLPCDKYQNDPIFVNIHQLKMSRAQMGDLRDLINPTITGEHIRKRFEDRYEKFSNKNDIEKAALFKRLKEIFIESGPGEVRNYIACLWDAYALYRYNKEHN